MFPLRDFQIVIINWSTGVKQSFQKIVDGVKDLFNKKEKNKSDLIIYVKIADQSLHLISQVTKNLK